MEDGSVGLAMKTRKAVTGEIAAGFSEYHGALALQFMLYCADRHVPEHHVCLGGNSGSDPCCLTDGRIRAVNVEGSARRYRGAL